MMKKKENKKRKLRNRIVSLLCIVIMLVQPMAGLAGSIVKAAQNTGNILELYEKDSSSGSQILIGGYPTLADAFSHITDENGDYAILLSSGIKLLSNEGVFPKARSITLAGASKKVGLNPEKDICLQSDLILKNIRLYTYVDYAYEDISLFLGKHTVTVQENTSLEMFVSGETGSCLTVQNGTVETEQLTVDDVRLEDGGSLYCKGCNNTIKNLYKKESSENADVILHGEENAFPCNLQIENIYLESALKLEIQECSKLSIGSVYSLSSAAQNLDITFVLPKFPAFDSPHCTINGQCDASVCCTFQTGNMEEKSYQILQNDVSCLKIPAINIGQVHCGLQDSVKSDITPVDFSKDGKGNIWLETFTPSSLPEDCPATRSSALAALTLAVTPIATATSTPAAVSTEPPEWSTVDMTGKVKLYFYDQLIGKQKPIGGYPSLIDAFSHITDQEGEYTILLTSTETEELYKEVWFPKAKSIKLLGTYEGRLNITTLVAGNDIHLQSDLILKDIVINSVSKDAVLLMGNHEVTVQERATQLLLPLNGEDDSHLLMQNSTLYAKELNIGNITLKNESSLLCYGYHNTIKNLYNPESNCHVEITGSTSGFPRYLDIGNVYLDNNLFLATSGNGKISVNNVYASTPQREWLNFDINLSEVSEYRTPHITISGQCNTNIFYSGIMTEKDYQAMRNNISFLKIPNIEVYQIRCQIYNHTRQEYVSFDISKDAEGNIWTEPLLKNPDEVSIPVCELNEECRDGQGIFYTLHEEDKTAVVGMDNDTNDNAGLGIEKEILYIPAQVKKDGMVYTVNRIGANAFKGNQYAIGLLKMADTVTSIGENAFRNSKLEKIIIGKNVSSLGKNIFTTSSLQNIFVDADNTNFMVYHDILFDASMETLIHFPTYAKGSDSDVCLPSSVRTIAEGAFHSCFAGYVYADSVTKIEDAAFLDSNIKGFSGKNVREIGERGFYRCEELSYLYLGEHLKSIGSEAFYYCKGLETVLLPDSVEIISKNAFSWSSKLKYVLGASHAQYEESLVSYCENLFLMELSVTMDTIAKWQFAGCKELKKLYLPDNYAAIYSSLSIEQTTCLYALPKQEGFVTKAGAGFYNRSNHIHTFLTKTLQESSKTLKGIEITYCSECHYVQSASFTPEKTSAIPTLLPDYKPVIRTPKPVETATPEPEEAITPKPEATATPEPEETVTPELEATATPESEETVTPVTPETIAPSDEPSGGNSGNNGSSGGSGVTGGGSSGGGGAGGGGGITAASPSPTPALPFIPPVTPSPSPLLPSVPVLTPSPTPAPTDTPVPGTYPEHGKTTGERQRLAKAKIISLKLNTYNQPVLQWKKTPSAAGYLVYRSLKKNSGYKPVYTARRTTAKYTDKKAAAGKRYYYRIRAFRNYGKMRYYGSFSSVRNIRLFNLKKPGFTAKKGVTPNRIYYIQIHLRKYSGTNVALYLKRGKRYSKIQLKSSSIQKYQGIFKLQCNRRHKIYYLKVRTYIWQKGKIYYSPYSKVVKVRI